MTYIGYSAGPPLGGLLATHFGWRSVFFINVPVGLLGFYMSYRLIAPDRPEGKAPPFDMLGAILFFIGLFALLLALNQGYAWGWSSPLTLGLIVASAVLLGVFFAVERRRAHPMLDLSLFRVPVFTGSVFSSMLNYAANSAIYFVLPFYLISSRGLNPQQTGLALVSMPAIMMLVAPLSGTLSDRLGSRWPTMFGLTVVVIGLLCLSRVAAPIPMWQISVTLFVCGIGFGSFIPPNNSRLLGAAPPNRQGIASGLLADARCLGMVLGVGVSGAVYTTVLHHHSGPQGVALGASMALKVIAGISGLAILTSWLEGEEVPGERAHAGKA
jgi:predicted MFS family arabinose efflux permease